MIDILLSLSETSIISNRKDKYVYMIYVSLNLYAILSGNKNNVADQLACKRLSWVRNQNVRLRFLANGNAMPWPVLQLMRICRAYLIMRYEMLVFDIPNLCSF